MSIVTGSFPLYSNDKLLEKIRSLGFLNMTTGPWVAGGAARRVYCSDDKTYGDIDIFINKNTKNSFQRIEKLLYARSSQIAFKENSAYLSFNVEGDIVQVIKNIKFESAIDLINDFDFTACMIATDGWDWIANENFFTAIEDKKLVFNNEDQNRLSLLRLAKYCKYGFTPIPGVFEKIANFNEIDKNGFLKPKNNY